MVKPFLLLVYLVIILNMLPSWMMTSPMCGLEKKQAMELWRNLPNKNANYIKIKVLDEIKEELKTEHGVQKFLEVMAREAARWNKMEQGGARWNKDESERRRKQLQSELYELNLQGEWDESELEDELQQTEDQKMKPEVSLQSWSIPYLDQMQEDLEAFNRQLQLEETGEKRKQFQSELNELILQGKLDELELEDEPQQTEDQKMKPEVNMQSWEITYLEQMQEYLNVIRQLKLEEAAITEAEVSTDEVPVRREDETPTTAEPPDEVAEADSETAEVTYALAEVENEAKDAEHADIEPVDEKVEALDVVEEATKVKVVVASTIRESSVNEVKEEVVEATKVKTIVVSLVRAENRDVVKVKDVNEVVKIEDEDEKHNQVIKLHNAEDSEDSALERSSTENKDEDLHEPKKSKLETDAAKKNATTDRAEDKAPDEAAAAVMAVTAETTPAEEGDPTEEAENTPGEEYVPAEEAETTSTEVNTPDPEIEAAPDEADPGAEDAPINLDEIYELFKDTTGEEDINAEAAAEVGAIVNDNLEVVDFKANSEEVGAIVKDSVNFIIT